MADQYRCDRCNQDFQDQAQLGRHNQEQHQGQQGQSQGQTQGGNQSQNPRQNPTGEQR